jgi:holo-[acyl-carrier protein] synthase
MSFRIGVDLVPFSRVEKLLSDETDLLSRYLSPAEIEASTNALGLDVAGIAGRLAAKEAYFKLLRTEGKPVPWLAIEVLPGSGGWPVLTVRDTAYPALDAVEVSITHDDGYAVAVAIGAAVPEQRGSRTTESEQRTLEHPRRNQQ